jgi:hypothetical protein
MISTIKKCNNALMKEESNWKKQILTVILLNKKRKELRILIIFDQLLGLYLKLQNHHEQFLMKALKNIIDLKEVEEE